MIQRKDFRIPSSAKSIVEDDILYLTGIANTGLEDLVGDVVTEDALTQICNQIPHHNLHLDHDGTLDGVLGPLTEGWVDGDGVHFKARILQEKRTLLESYLQQGLNMGASISGVCEYESGSNTDIATWQLTEISLTPIPCDQATMGSVEIAKSFRDAVQAVQAVQEKNNNNDDDEGDNMAENNEEPITIEKVEELINTAFNEKQEDLIETVRGELKSEYEAVLNELKERIETLESQQGEGNNETESTEEGEGETTSTPAIGEGESKADNEDEEKPRKEDEDETESTEEEDDEEDEKEDDKKHLEDMIEKAVHKTIQGIFNPKNAPSFQYEKNTEEDVEEQKGYTPRELAEMLTQTRQ